MIEQSNLNLVNKPVIQMAILWKGNIMVAGIIITCIVIIFLVYAISITKNLHVDDCCEHHTHDTTKKDTEKWVILDGQF